MAKTRRAPEDDVRRRRPDDDEDDAPRKARRRDDDDDEEEDDQPFAPRKKRKSAKGPIKLVLRICLGIAIAVCIIILLIWVYSPVGTDHSMLCYLPPETTNIQGYDAEEGLKNHKLKDVHETLMSNYRQFGGQRFSETSGVNEKDVAKYLSGVASAKDPESEKDLPPQERRGSITVIKFKKAVDNQKFVNSFGGNFKVEERSTKDGKKYHHLYRLVWTGTHEERQDDISFFFPNSRTLVYTSTWRECEEALTRQPGRVVLEGDMRELSDKVDGCYFQASAGWFEFPNGVSNTMAFGLGFMDAEVRDQKTFTGRTGTASWFADNGNDFLYASAALYTDVKTARSVRRKVSDSIDKAIEDIWQSDGGRPGGLDDPFNPKQNNQQGGGFGAGGFGGGGGASSEQTKDILEALSEWAETARVYNRGRLVIVEGRISHGPPEQGTFEKFWRAVGQKFHMGGFGGMGGRPGMGPPGMMGPGMPGPGGPPPPPR